ncbi:polysaccharide deacetylase [Ruminiclostridium sufflavum DSM 19573]|uniref:Polysaccharide deacetylase n=1 Tax=Ruminiclostridium sufflavum DSM 19573 TaxID=1121337 RepID=A0A318Y958_9FIRM|nr:polysaccharide deacetylase family protein [Ruminiclostridium sufflavum]PYG88838.1 polysaccharide deacetylase [Ruminiclostridium sufflavum DSM 19573]
MRKNLTLLMVFIMILSSGCTNNLYSSKEVNQSKNSAIDEVSNETQGQASTGALTSGSSSKGGKAEASASSQKVNAIDYNTVKPNECGQIMVVMFHNFIEEYQGKGDKAYTTTFSEFQKLLQDLYDRKYRLISLTDMLNNNIDIPAGCIPMVFTFDDGTAGQFSLTEKAGKLVVNPRSAVGIMEEFNKTHPDFGLSGTFYVNLGVKTTFKGDGTMSERLKYLIDKGFEIGNHTKTHVSLPEVKTSQKMLEEVGGNQKLMNEYVPGYVFNSFSLPFGSASKNLKEYVIHGNYEGTEYRHSAVMLVGANPAPSPVSVKFDPLAVPRVRATGITKVECDLAWWLDAVSKGSSQYVSDGNADTVAVPKSKKENVDMAKLNGKQLIEY